MILFNYVLFLELFEAEYEDEEDEEDVINDEKNEEDEINERCECVICFEKHRAIIFDPCGHIYFYFIYFYLFFIYSWHV